MKKNKKQIKFDVPSPILESRLPLFLSIAIIVGWGIFVLKNYWQVYPLSPFATFERIFSLIEFPNANWATVRQTWTGHFLNLLFILFFWISIFGFGKYCFSLFLKEDREENNLFCIAFGIAVTIAFFFIIGIFGYLYPFPIIVFLLIGFILGISPVIKIISGFKSHKFPLNEKFYLLLLAYPLLHGFIGALSPETFFDSAVYHLGVPQAWINSHRIYEMPSLNMSYFPFNIQSLYTIGLLLRNEMAAKLISLSFGLFTTVALFTMLKKYFSREAAWLGIAIFCCTPFVPLLAGKTAIEIGISFFETLAFFALLNWFNIQDKSKKWLIISAICSGLGMGSKYISIYATFSLVILIFFIRFFKDKASFKDIIKEEAIFIFVSVIVVSPWLIRNFIWSGDPFFPLLWEKLGHLKLRNLGYLADPPRRPFTVKNILVLPYEYALGKNTQESFCGPIFLILIPLFIFFKKKDKQINPFIIYSTTYYFVWQYVQAHFRFFVPALPVLSSIYAYFVINQPSSFWRKTLIWTIIILSFGNVQLASVLQKYSENPLGVFLGLTSRYEHLAQGKGIGSYVSPNFNTVDWINKNLPKNSYILLLGELRGLYIQRRFLAHTTSEFIPITELVKNSGNADEVYRKLIEQGFTHILLNAKEVYRLKSYNLYYWDKHGWEIFNNFWSKYVKEIYAADFVYVYEITPHKFPVIPKNFLDEIYNSK